MNKEVVVCFSSGHDSFYCLSEAIETYGNENVLCLIFEYGQTNALEICNAVDACKDIGVDFEVIKLPDMKREGNKRQDVSSQYYPARNLVFLSVASSVAEQLGAEFVYIGVCREDNYSFPDCRLEFVDKFDSLYKTAYGNVSVVAPCLYRTKKETYDLLMQSSIAQQYLKYTYSCYNNSSEPFYDRKGCGSCQACLSLKRNIFDAAE